ncbi:MAG: EamA family transporter RarD [Lautropia sp.]|nr:EamA family transporter RarD [Lautropia sp.]
MDGQQGREYRKGIWFALGCYGIWGIFPLYWYPLNHAPIGAEQILAQRVLWSMLFSMVLLVLSGQSDRFLCALRRPRLLGMLMLSALLIGANWLVYLWAIVDSHVLDASLGYFVSPLANVLLGRVMFGERPSALQWLAVVLAGIGIAWLAIPAGHVPWVAVLLAASFSLYGVVRKLAPFDALPAMALETMLLAPLAIGYLWWSQQRGTLVFGDLSALQLTVLICSGAATTIPLLLFGGAARRIPLSLLGMLQYGSPTLQLILGLLVFGEQFSLPRLIGYGWVWAGVAIYLLVAWNRSRQTHSSTSTPLGGTNSK